MKFSFKHVKFEIGIRHPSYFNKKAVGYINLDFKGTILARGIN